MPKTLDELRAELEGGLDARKPKDIREDRPEEPPPELSDSDLTPKQPKLPRTAVEFAAAMMGEPVTLANANKEQLIQMAKDAGVDIALDATEQQLIESREAMPIHHGPERAKVDLSKKKAAGRKANTERRTSKGGKYSISADGCDAVLLFGKHNGESVSTLSQDRDARGYLTWIVRDGEFDADLVEICEYQLGLNG